VTSSYNILAAQRVIRQLREVRVRTGGTFQIIVGGYAFEHNPGLAGDLGADRLVSDYEGIRRLTRGV
jgi:hypothetical protein